MHIDASFLRSRVARRIFFLFVLSALLPIALMLGLSLRALNSDLEQSLGRDLRQAAKTYALSLYERLVLADEELELMQDHDHLLSRHQSTSAGIRYLSMARIDGESIVQMHGPIDRRMLLPGATRARLAQGQPLLVPLPGGDGASDLMLVNPARDGRQGYLAAVLRPEYVWGSRDVLPYLTDFCIRNTSGTLLHCTSPAHAGLLGDGAPVAGSGLLSESFDLFLRGHFGARDWRILALHPAPEARSRLVALNRIFISVALLAILLVAFLSVVQIRRTLVPLESLIEGTRRLAKQDFTPLAESGRNDEFTELARAFNAMSGELQAKFRVLDAQGRIDRMILTELNLERILETVLRGLCEVVPADGLCVAAIDRTLGDKAQLHCLAGTTLTVARIDFSADDQACLAHLEAGRLFERADCPGVCLPAWPDRPHVTYLPVRWKDELVAVLGLGFASAGQLTASVRRHAEEVAGRIGVALSALAREETLYRQAHYDSLTGLANRLSFLDWLDREVSRAIREEDSLALLFMDLDRFKLVNDSQGHAAGDQLLREVATRLRQQVRGDSLIARLGGDEFMICLPRLRHRTDAGTVADHIIYALSQPFVIQGQEHHVGVSIGIAFCPQDGDTAEALIRNADTAMYRAKSNGRDQFMYFEESMNSDVQARLQLDNELRHALERREFVVFWQAQQHLGDGALSGVEVLIRWRHPERGLVPPGLFIDYAERSGLIEGISAQVVDQACAQFHRWMDLGIAPPRMAINLTARNLRQPDFVEWISYQVRRHHVPCERVELEITEGSFIDNLEAMRTTLTQLRQLGFKLAIDDFGTGYSSLSYLSRLPANILKIDRSFVMHTSQEENYRSICRAIIHMGHALNMEIVAEGVETAAERDFLRREGCDILQGYLYSKPLPTAQFEAFLKDQAWPDQASA